MIKASTKKTIFAGRECFKGVATVFINGKYFFSQTHPCPRLTRADALEDANWLAEGLKA